LTPLSLADDSEVNVLDGQLSSGAELVLFDLPGLFDRAGIYAEAGVEYADNAWRFAAFARAVGRVTQQRAELGKAVDVVHAHDAVACLVPLALRGQSVPVVFTIHDIERRAEFPAVARSGLGFSDLSSLELGGGLSGLASALSLSAAVTTVSAHYAQEILDPARSGALSGALSKLPEGGARHPGWRGLCDV